MILNITIIILVSIIIILAIAIPLIVRRYGRRIKGKDYMHARLRQSYQELNDKNKELEREKEISELSLKNMAKALTYQTPVDGKRHIFVRSIDHDQRIVLIFDEEYHYILEYFDQKPLVNKDPYISSRNIECTAFIDGSIYDPLSMDPIFQSEKRVEIIDINSGKYTGRGLGTCVIQCLEKVLKEIDINELEARLSPVDFHNKDKLYNFYINKNGFNLIDELTEHKRGRVKKFI